MLFRSCDLDGYLFENSRYPRDIMQPSRALLTLEEARYRLLRPPPSSGLRCHTLPEILAAAASREELETHRVLSVDWRILVSISQVANVNAYWPADILCTPPHFDTWLSDRQTLPRPSADEPHLLDLTQFQRHEQAALTAKLPTYHCVYLVYHDAWPGWRKWAKANGVVMVQEFAGAVAPVVYEADWWRTGNRATRPATAAIGIWATREILHLLSPHALSAAQRAYPSPPLHTARDLAPDGTVRPARSRQDGARLHTYMSFTAAGPYRHNPYTWLVATDGSVASAQGLPGALYGEGQVMGAGLVLVKPL